MAYQPKVIKAEIVSNNPKNGLFEVVVELKDRTSCRLIYEKNTATGTAFASHINRLLKEPCPICRKDFLCNCMDNYKADISQQTLEMVGTP
jgi:hypothetical protein